MSRPTEEEYAQMAKAVGAGNFSVRDISTADGKKFYPGKVQWALKRNDVNPAGPAEPAYYLFHDEAEARDWYDSSIDAAKQNLPDDKDRWPELVKCQMHWEVVE